MIQERRKLSYFGRLVSKEDPASAMKWVFLFTFIFLNVVMWGTWFALCIYKQELLNVPEGLGLAYAGALAVVTGGKVIQSKIETQQGDCRREEIPVPEAGK